MMKKGIYTIASYIAAVFAVLGLLVYLPVASAKSEYDPYE